MKDINLFKQTMTVFAADNEVRRAGPPAWHVGNSSDPAQRCAHLAYPTGAPLPPRSKDIALLLMYGMDCLPTGLLSMVVKTNPRIQTLRQPNEEAYT